MRPAMWFGLLGALALTLVSVATAGSPNGAGKSRTCFGKNPTIVGTQHRDLITGTQGRDVVTSLGGNDSIRSRKGNDYVCAGRGDDTVHGAEGFNRMNGGPGDDWLDGRRGPGNLVIGGKGADHVQAEGKIDGGPGNDTIESYGYRDPASRRFPTSPMAVAAGTRSTAVVARPRLSGRPQRQGHRPSGPGSGPAATPPGAAFPAGAPAPSC